MKAKERKKREEVLDFLPRFLGEEERRQRRDGIKERQKRETGGGERVFLTVRSDSFVKPPSEPRQKLSSFFLSFSSQMGMDFIASEIKEETRIQSDYL